MDWRSSRALLPGLIGHMGQGGRFVVLAAEPTRFSAIGYRQMLPKEGCRLGGACYNSGSAFRTARCPTKGSMRRLYEPKDRYTEVRQEGLRDREGGQRIHGRGTSRDEGARPRAEGGSAPRPAREAGGRGTRRAREDCRDAETGSRHGRAAPCHHQSQRASPLAENLVRDARVRQGRQCRLLLPKRAQVQGEVRDLRLQRQGEPRRRHLWPVAFALKELTAADEARIGALVKKAVS